MISFASLNWLITIKSCSLSSAFSFGLNSQENYSLQSFYNSPVLYFSMYSSYTALACQSVYSLPFIQCLRGNIRRDSTSVISFLSSSLRFSTSAFCASLASFAVRKALSRRTHEVPSSVL